MGDSQQYNVLSIEEVDETKKGLATITSRIEATKRKLVLESKLRDAAQSLHRLNTNTGRDVSGEGSPNSPKRHRRSLMGSRSSGGSDLFIKTDSEMAAITKKCEELAQELWKLDQRAQKLHRVLLEHTAGILQMTHKGYLSRVAPPSTPDTKHGYSSRTNDEADDFDERSWYRSHDTLDEFSAGIESEQRQGNSARGPQIEQSAPQTEAIVATEEKLRNFNTRLKEMLGYMGINQPLRTPPSHSSEHNPETDLKEQLGLLETGLEAVSTSYNDSLHRAESQVQFAEQKIRGINTRLHAHITRSRELPDSDYSSPLQASGVSMKDQISYLEGGLDVMEQRIQHLRDALHTSSSRSANHQENAEQLETVLTGLWSIMFVGEADKGQQNGQDRSVGVGDRNGEYDDEFSLHKFSGRVQALYRRATALEEQKEILTHQVQQERELGSKSISEKESHLADLRLEHEKMKKTLEISDRDAKATEVQLALAVERLDATKHHASLREEQKGMDNDIALKAEKAARREAEERLITELQAKEEEISELATRLTGLRDEGEVVKFELQAKLQDSEERVQDLSAQLNEFIAARAQFEVTEAQSRQTTEEKTKEVASMHQEIERLEAEVVRLHTEVTVARAELDGAYGTRAQRAAEVATNPAFQKELDDLNDRNKSLLKEITVLKAYDPSASSGGSELTERVEVLQRELAETIGEYEDMTKSSIEFEKEREQLEATIDSLRDRCENLDSQLSDEKVRWLGMKSPGSGGRDSLVPSNTSTMVLKNEFKKMMRETRAENMKALRVRFCIL